jgi:MraZ protein
MFIGEYSHTIDEKGRVQVPVKFRAGLASGAVVTKGEDGCLFLYPRQEWDELAKKIGSLPTISSRGARAAARKLLAGAMDVEIDRQGRVNLPGYLRAYASLKGSAILAGVYDRIEVWDPLQWEEYKRSTEGADSPVADQIGELGI